jgi:hypothetical protein
MPIPEYIPMNSLLDSNLSSGNKGTYGQGFNDTGQDEGEGNAQIDIFHLTKQPDL